VEDVLITRKPCTNLASWLALSPTYWNELPLEPYHLGVPSGASKTIFEPMLCLVQNVHLSSCDTNTISERTQTRFQMSHVTLEFHRVHPKWFSSLWYIRHKPCIYLASRLALSPNEPKQASTSASLPRCSISFIQNDSWAYDTLAQTVHLSCVKISTVFKRTETSFHLSLVT
jgi:hypothetical protein